MKKKEEIKRQIRHLKEILLFHSLEQEIVLKAYIDSLEWVLNESEGHPQTANILPSEAKELLFNATNRNNKLRLKKAYCFQPQEV
jgi:hypothetical protein